MVVQIKNPDISDNVRTTISTNYTSGTTLYVESGTGFANGNYIVVGEPGLETTEVTDITAAPGATSLTITGMSFAHNRSTPVYYTRWDKYSLEYRTSSSGTWTAYASMPATLKYDGTFTEYRDTTATSSYEWRYRYYSTEASAYSDYSDTITSTGWSDQAAGYMVRNIRKIANDPEGKTVSDAEILRMLNAAQQKVYSIYDRWWFLFTEYDISTVASTNTYTLPSDFGRMHSVLYNYISGDTNINYQLKFISIAEMDYEARDNSASTDDEVKYFTIYPSATLKVSPTPDTAGLTLKVRYYKRFADLDSYGDETPVTIPAILEDYVLGQIYFIRGQEDKGSYYDKLFRQQIDLLKLEQRKFTGPPRYMWQWRGRKGAQTYWGNVAGNSDTSAESDW